jgi:hypothetical protein
MYLVAAEALWQTDDILENIKNIHTAHPYHTRFGVLVQVTDNLFHTYTNDVKD